jgi:hypothetical protein
MSLEAFKLVQNRLKTPDARPPEKEANSFRTQIKALIDTYRDDHPYPSSPDYRKIDTMMYFGFNTFIQSKDAKPMYATIFVGNDVVDVEVWTKGCMELHETYLIKSRGYRIPEEQGILYSKDEVTHKSQRWLTTDKKDRSALKHLQNLIRDVQNYQEHNNW